MNDKRRPQPGSGAANNTRRDLSKRERQFTASESRRVGVGLVAVDAAIRCMEGRCDCDCREKLEEIINRHGGPGEAA